MPKTLIWLAILLALNTCRLWDATAAGDEPQSAQSKQALNDVLNKLRAEEAKYRDIEYKIRVTTVTGSRAGALPEIRAQENRRVVLQGDKIWFDRQRFQWPDQKEVRHEEISACDGQKTVSIVIGNSVNIHSGRFEHPDIHPAHTVPLVHYWLNFPLSVYLAGTEAIHRHEKYGQSVRDDGSVREFPKVLVGLDGEEVVDGLRCVRVRCERWYTLRRSPVVQLLWLCPERNWFCIKEERYRTNSAGVQALTDETHVAQWKEVLPETWFPQKVVALSYRHPPGAPPIVHTHVETVVDHVNLSPEYDPAFFHEIAVPNVLPVFHIEGNRLVGSSLPEPVGGEEEARKLQEIVAQVRKHEARYSQLQVEARKDYVHLGSDIVRGVYTDHPAEMYSAMKGTMAYFRSDERITFFGSEPRTQSLTEACHGQWERSVRRMTTKGEPEKIYPSIRRHAARAAQGRHDGIPVLRPHTFLVRDDWLYGPLADLLVSPWLDRANKYRQQFRYCGQQQMNGHPCVVLRGDVTVREGQPPSSYRVLWLATDRNYIPIRTEVYGGSFGIQPMPEGIGRCEDFREISPHTWYPFKTIYFAFNKKEMDQRRLVLNWRREYEVKSATLEATADDVLFRTVVAPAGSEVRVYDEDRRFLGTFPQEAEGVLELDHGRYQSMLEDAKRRDEETIRTKASQP